MVCSTSTWMKSNLFLYNNSILFDDQSTFSTFFTHGNRLCSMVYLTFNFMVWARQCRITWLLWRRRKSILRFKFVIKKVVMVCLTQYIAHHGLNRTEVFRWGWMEAKETLVWISFPWRKLYIDMLKLCEYEQISLQPTMWIIHRHLVIFLIRLL